MQLLSGERRLVEARVTDLPGTRSPGCSAEALAGTAGAVRCTVRSADGLVPAGSSHRTIQPQVQTVRPSAQWGRCVEKWRVTRGLSSFYSPPK